MAPGETVERTCRLGIYEESYHVYYDANGGIQSSDAMRITQDYIPVIGGTKCLIKVKIAPASTSKLRVHQYDASQQWISQVFVSTGNISTDKIDTFTFELDANARYIRFSLPRYSVLELYENAETISVDWEAKAGTVYGGTVDIVSGKLVVDKRGKTFTGTEQEEWFKNSSGNYFYTKLEDFNMGVTSSQLCDILPNAVISSSNDQQGVYAFNSNSHQIFGLYVRWSSLMSMDVTAFKSWLSSNPLTVMYELASPVEYQLTPQEVGTLLRENNLWSDGGDISVEYPADTKTYIDAFSIKTVEVSGQTPAITAEENTRYICGEVTSLTFTPCASGICDVRFTAASISTVLTLPQTLKLPDWFDPTSLEANVTYEINIVDGVYGAVMSWA